MKVGRMKACLYKDSYLGIFHLPSSHLGSPLSSGLKVWMPGASESSTFPRSPPHPRCFLGPPALASRGCGFELLGFRVEGLGLMVQGLGFRVEGVYENTRRQGVPYCYV